MRYLPRKRPTLTADQIRAKLIDLRDRQRSLDRSACNYNDRARYRYQAKQAGIDVATEIARLEYQLWELTGEEAA